MGPVISSDFARGADGGKNSMLGCNLQSMARLISGQERSSSVPAPWSIHPGKEKPLAGSLRHVGPWWMVTTGIGSLACHVDQGVDDTTAADSFS